jgi:hypothetical protein
MSKGFTASLPMGKKQPFLRPPLKKRFAPSGMINCKETTSLPKYMGTTSALPYAFKPETDVTPFSVR